MTNIKSQNATTTNYKNIVVHPDTLSVPKKMLQDTKAKYTKHDTEMFKRIARSKKITIDKVFCFDDRVYIFLMRGNIVIIDIDKLILTCTCADFNFTSQKNADYCKHQFRCVDWLVEENGSAIRLNGRQNAEIKINASLQKKY